MKHHDWMSLQSPFSELQDLERLLDKLFDTRGWYVMEWSHDSPQSYNRNDHKDSVSLQLQAALGALECCRLDVEVKSSGSHGCWAVTRDFSAPWGLKTHKTRPAEGRIRLRAMECGAMQLPCAQSAQHLSKGILSVFQPEEASRRVPLQPVREDDFRLCLQQVCSM